MTHFLHCAMDCQMESSHYRFNNTLLFDPQRSFLSLFQSLSSSYLSIIFNTHFFRRIFISISLYYEIRKKSQAEIFLFLTFHSHHSPMTYSYFIIQLDLIVTYKIIISDRGSQLYFTWNQIVMIYLKIF